MFWVMQKQNTSRGTQKSTPANVDLGCGDLEKCRVGQATILPEI